MREAVPKLFLVRVIMKAVRNIVEDVKFIITTKMCSVLVAEDVLSTFPIFDFI
jgi:hypothetical protein